MNTKKDNELRPAAQGEPGALVQDALTAFLLAFRKGMMQVEAAANDPEKTARFMVTQFLKEYPAIAAAFELRDAGMRVMLSSADIKSDTVLSAFMVTELNNALEAAGAWDDMVQLKETPTDAA